MRFRKFNAFGTALFVCKYHIKYDTARLIIALLFNEKHFKKVGRLVKYCYLRK